MNHRAFWRDLVYLLVCKLFGCKVVFQLHGGSLEELCAKPGMRGVVRRVFSMPDALVVLANSEMRDFRQLGISDRLVVIQNAVDIARYGAAGERVHSGKVYRMAFMGRLIRPKGMFEAMEAVRLLHGEKDTRDVELWIAGSGPAREEVESWIRENAMQGCIKLVGSIYGQDKIEFLLDADIFVFPTYHREGLPYVILECLAAGTPIITTKVGGIPDVVTDRVHGMLIDAKNPQQIVAAVHELARSEENLRTMSKNCRAFAVQQLGLDRLATQFGELYEKLLA
jgi:glycosyltransferase involved in cell wall biosynthesis